MIRQKTSLWLKSISIGLAVILVLYLGLSIYGARKAMEIPRLALGKDTPASVGLMYEDVVFTSLDDRVSLKGWYLPGRFDSVIIIVHGGFQNRLDENVNTLELARDLVQNGWSVLLFDLRGRGESEGKALSLSNIEKDIGGSVDYLKTRGYSDKHVFVIGFCSGAASACIFASRNNLGGLVLDGCFATVTGMVVNQAKKLGIPEFLVKGFAPGILCMARLSYGYRTINPIDDVGKIACPIFFIHEEKDDVITWEETQLLYRNSTNPANQIWEVEAAEHSQSYKSQPAEYIKRVSNFFLNNTQTHP
jgi:uncharacterized protein